MLYTVPTKKGLGIEIWGTDDDLTFLHQTINKFWNDENFDSNKGWMINCYQFLQDY